jgi:hypothetical protein
MKIFRFMSNDEFQKFQAGEVLENTVHHQGKTNSVGFCFLNIKEFAPEKAMHFLSGIVSFDICAVFETEKKLQKTYGIYAKPIKSTGNLRLDLMNLYMRLSDKFTANEYCTTKYDNKNFKLIKYSKNIWSQHEVCKEQPELKWIENN